MIRYVLAVVLAAALVSIGWAGFDYAAAVRSEQQVENQVASIDEAATSLVEHDDPPATGQPGARRVVELRFPHGGLTSERIDRFHIRPTGANVSIAEYSVDGRPVRTVTIDARVRDGNTNATVTAGLSGETGTTTVVLALKADDNGPYVELRTPPTD